MPKVVSVELIDLEQEVDVFDIEVETDASFIVGSAVLHNSDICRSRSGLLWTLEGIPIGHSLIFVRPPLHYNCRSHLVPVLHAFRDLPPRLQRRIDPDDFDGRAAERPDLKIWLAQRRRERDQGPIDYSSARTQLGL